jgi:hypothetical protein
VKADGAHCKQPMSTEAFRRILQTTFPPLFKKRLKSQHYSIFGGFLSAIINLYLVGIFLQVKFYNFVFFARGFCPAKTGLR